MRPVNFGRPMGQSVEAKLTWIIGCLREIEEASNIDPLKETVISYEPTNVTETRTFDANTATLAVVADVLGTVLLDIQKGGPKRT